MSPLPNKDPPSLYSTYLSKSPFSSTSEYPGIRFVSGIPSPKGLKLTNRLKLICQSPLCKRRDAVDFTDCRTIQPKASGYTASFVVCRGAACRGVGLKGSDLLREPLVYFLLAGVALFVLTGALSGDDARHIVVSDAERARLSAQWQAQMGRAPTDNELSALVEQWIREEIYYREAIAMGLDQDDVIIRRRLAQKLTFLTEDLATAEAPSRDMLRAFYEAHLDRYQEPARWTFSHRYFSGERREQPQAEARAALEVLAEGAAPTGDAFMLQQDYVGRSQREIAELFGREFAAALAELPTGSWQGPVRSAYGWHLVRMDDRQPPRQLPFPEVVDRVAADYRQEARQEANEAYYQSLRARYEIDRS